MFTEAPSQGPGPGAPLPELIRVVEGRCSGPLRSDRGPAVLVVVEGTGSALAGDVWLAVGSGDRVLVDAGEPCALRSTGAPMAALFVRPSPASTKAA